MGRWAIRLDSSNKGGERQKMKTIVQEEIEFSMLGERKGCILKVE